VIVAAQQSASFHLFDWYGSQDSSPDNTEGVCLVAHLACQRKRDPVCSRSVLENSTRTKIACLRLSGEYHQRCGNLLDEPVVSLWLPAGLPPDQKIVHATSLFPGQGCWVVQDKCGNQSRGAFIDSGASDGLAVFSDVRSQCLSRAAYHHRACLSSLKHRVSVMHGDTGCVHHFPYPPRAAEQSQCTLTESAATAFRAAYQNRALQLALQNRFGDAELNLRAALRVSSISNESDFQNLGTVLFKQGKLNASLAAFRSAGGLGVASTAQTLIYLGRQPEAYSLLQPIMDSGKAGLVIILVWVQLAGKFGFKFLAADYLELILREHASGTRALDRAPLLATCFHAAALYDKNRQITRAWHHVEQANALASQAHESTVVEQDIQHVIDGVGVWLDLAQLGSSRVHTAHAIYKACSLSRVGGSVGTNQRNITPVFVVGMPRSGTTLVAQMLGANSKACPIGEDDILGRLAIAFYREVAKDSGREVGEWHSNRTLGALSNEGIRSRITHLFWKHVYGKIDAECLASNCTHVVIDTGADFRHIPFMTAFIPEGKVVHSTRNPLDTTISILFSHFDEGHSWAYSLPHIAQYFMAYQFTMRHWGLVGSVFTEYQPSRGCASALQALGDGSAILRYEAVVENPQLAYEPLLQYLGLDWEQRMLHFYNDEHISTTSSNQQVQQPIYNSSVGRWERYKPNMAEFLEKFDFWKLK
jgi:tetratricopeptide (TPR) repeat protein